MNAIGRYIKKSHGKCGTNVLAMAIFAHILLINAAFAAATTAFSLSDFVVPCKSKDPNLNECIRTAAESLFKQAGQGKLADLGIHQLDPVVVPKLDMARNGAVTMNLSFTNSTHYGLGDIKVTKASADFEKHVYQFRIIIPKYTIVGDYDISGKVILLPIAGHGKSTAAFTDVEADWTFTGETEERDGKTYLKINKVQTSIIPESPKKVQVHFDGLFGGNKVLGDTMNSFLNSNWQELATQMKPNIQHTFESRMLPHAQAFVSHFELNELFSDL